MPTTFNVISLGNVADMDMTEGNDTAENASALVGQTFGGVGSPLANQFVEFSPGTGGFSGGSAGYYDQDNAPAENFRIDGGPDQVYDSAARFQATLTYIDGTTASVNVAIFQDTAGNAYLAPETSQNTTQNALEAAPIRSITLDSLVADTTSGLVADRDSFAYATCFTPGVRIRTPTGPAPVEALRLGDLVSTLDNGPQPIRWIGCNAHRAVGNFVPIRIRAGALGQGLPQRDMLLSQHHRVLVVSRIAERLYGHREVLIPAKKLLGLDGIDLAHETGMIVYLHLLFDRHEIVFADGAPAESLLIGPMSTNVIGADVLGGIEERHPGILARTCIPARMIARGKRATRLMERHRTNCQPLIQIGLSEKPNSFAAETA